MTLEAAVMVDERRMMWDPAVMCGSAFFLVPTEVST